MQPSEGHILVDGRDLTSLPPSKRNIGMVFQNYSLFPFMTVAENVAFPLQNRRVPKAEIAERVAGALKMVRMSGMAERLPRQLSGGQQQRVALARAFVYNPPLLLMDEPLGALDKNLREEMQDEIKELHRTIGATIIYVTHDQYEAAAMADRIAVMNHGRLEQVGPAHELYENPRNAFIAGFLGEANMFEVESLGPDADGMRQVRTACGLSFLTSHPDAAGGAEVAFVRPECVRVLAEPQGHRNGAVGTVVDTVFATGVLRYRGKVGDGPIVVARVHAERLSSPFSVGDMVHLGWDSEDTKLVGNMQNISH